MEENKKMPIQKWVKLPCHIEAKYWEIASPPRGTCKSLSEGLSKYYGKPVRAYDLNVDGIKGYVYPRIIGDKFPYVDPISFEDFPEGTDTEIEIRFFPDDFDFEAYYKEEEEYAMSLFNLK